MPTIGADGDESRKKATLGADEADFRLHYLQRDAILMSTLPQQVSHLFCRLGNELEVSVFLGIALSFAKRIVRIDFHWRVSQQIPAQLSDLPQVVGRIIRIMSNG